MTIPEIKALREELEVALRQAFSDFQVKTGLAVIAVELLGAQPGIPLTKVTVRLESI